MKKNQAIDVSEIAHKIDNGPAAFARFQSLSSRIATTPKAELVKDEPRKPVKGKSRKR